VLAVVPTVTPPFQLAGHAHVYGPPLAGWQTKIVTFPPPLPALIDAVTFPLSTYVASARSADGSVIDPLADALYVSLGAFSAVPFTL
jgi:hypothetical protein